MTKVEACEITLQNRKTLLESKQKELEELDNQLKLIDFEEDIYSNLAERKYKYKDVFENKRAERENACKQLEEKVNSLKEEIKILSIEIEYIESIISSSK